jgi:ribosomal protein S3
MGQKTDARIFRQGVNKKNWELKHIEKNNEESSLYLYKTLEIQKYLNRFFGLYKIKIHNCKIFYSDSSLQIFVSFYITTKTFYVIKKNVTKYSKEFSTEFHPTLSNEQKKNWKKKNWKKIKNESLQFKPLLSSMKKLKMKKFQKINRSKNASFNKLKKYWTMDLKGFQEILLKSLETYTKNKVNISVTLQNLNRYKQLSHVQIENLKQIFKQLRNFTKNSFFKEAINILLVSISKRKSAKVLAEFISDQFRLNQLRTDQMSISRKDNYFLGFLKQTVMLLIKSDTSCLTGVKIVIKGRFNRAPRARASSIHFGKFSLQSFNSRIDYHQSTAYTVNGTFGVKVWLCENDY